MYNTEGIDFSYEHKTQCPKCASEGGDRSGDNLHVYGLDDDGKSLGAYCFDEDTDVFTYNGIKKIKDLIGKQTRIVNGNAEWEEVVFRSYGFDEIYELEISSNMIKKTIKTTANHLWFVKNNEKCLRTDELKPRHYLIGGELPKKSFKLIKDAVAHGFVFGDGSLHWRGNSSAVPFYSKTKYAVYEYLKDADCVITVGVRKRDTEVMPNLTFRHDKYSFKSLPLLAESDDYLFSWLSGYFAADGCLHGTGSSILNSANKEHLEFVEKVCARLGIRTRKIKSQARAEGKSFLRKGESTLYNIRFYTKDLPENFFIREAHKKPNVKYDRKAWKVLSVKKTGIIKEVYCCETSTQSFLLADYILTHNCFRCNFTVPSEEFLEEIGKDSFSGNYEKRGESMISKKDEQKLKEKSLTPEQLAEIYNKTSDTLTVKYRGLDGNVAKELGVRWEYNTDGSLKAMYFPAYVKDNGEMKVTGYKVRGLPKNFHSVGYIGRCNLMGGMTSQVAETLIVVAGECFTDETEVMTEHGFVSFSELKQDDKVLQINESMQGEFVKPVAIIRKNFTGKLVGHETLTTHTLTTPNHNLVFKTIKGKVFKQKASDKVSSGWLIPKTTTVSGNGINLSNDEIKLVLAVCADGSLRNRVVGNNAVHLSFVKERKVNRLKGILERLKISYTSYVNTYDNGKTYTTFNFILPDYIVDKNIPKSWLVDATLQQRLFILEELRYWDGHYQEKKRSMEFTSKHLDECLFVQELAHTAGLYASVRHRTNQYGEWYRCCVSYSMKNATTQSLYTYEKNYSGNVYCVTVPTGMILTRHKGKVTVCGNCDLITATQAMKSADKYRKSYNIITSLTGESSAADDLKNHYEWVNKHQKIIICMDNDSAGEKAFDEIKKVVDNDKLYKANLRHKDLNDYLKNGDGDKLVNDLYWQAIPYENYGLIGSSDLFDKALDMVALERIPLPPFLSGLDEAFSGGIALGEVVNIVSSVSTGKSVFVNEIVLDWIINSPYKMMIISLEDNGGSYLIKIASRIINNKIMTLRTADERKQALIDHRDEIDKYLVDEDGYNRFIFKEDSTSDLDIMKRAILQAIKVFGVRIILLDPLMSLIGSKSLDEQVKWMEFEEETRRIHNVTFINVAHTRKSSGGSQAHSEGGSISEEDIKGSQQISATATTNIILRRNKMAEDEIERNTTYVDITKNRTIGITGRDLARIYYSNKHHTLFDFNYAEQNNFFNDMSSEQLKEVIDFNKATPVSSSLDDVEELNDAMDASSLVSNIIPTDNIPDW